MNITLALQAMLPSAKHAFKAILCATVLSLAMPSCRNGNEAQTTDKSIADSLARLRQEGKAMRNESRFDEALQLHTRGLDLAKEVGDTAEWIQALNNIGTDYRRMGILDVAQEYHYTAYRMCEESTDTAYVMRKNRVVSLNGLGNIYLSVGNLDRADTIFHLALEGERQLGSAVGQAINYANLGSIYSSQGRDEEALECYKQSMRLNRESENVLGQSLCHIYFGSLSEKHGDYEAALDQYQQAYDLMKDSHDKWHSLETVLSLASANFDLHREQEALRLLREADTVARSIHSREHLVTVNMLYYRIFEREGKYRQALEHHVLATNLQDSVLDSKKRDRIHNIGINIERGRQQRRVDLAHEELKVERQEKWVNMLISLAIVMVLLAIIVAMQYVQVIRKRHHKMLVKATQMREEFFTNVTHEFRTPLTVILGLSQEIARKRTTDADTQHQAKSIHRQGVRLLELVTQLLDISRVKSAVGEPDWRHGNLAAQVEMMVETYMDYAQERGINISYNRPAELQTDFVPDYVNKVVGNLLSNALKFTPKGGSITVSLKQESKHITLSVSDTGAGMTKEEQSHILEPFYTNESKENPHGTGVGLALVNEIVKATGGSITWKSAPGEGTTFCISIPIQHRGKPISESEMYSEPAPTDIEPDDEAPETINEGQSLKQILIVEDNSDVASFIGSQLGKDYEIHFAQNGKEGLDMARSLIPDLIISDVMMPMMDGLEFCRLLRADELVCHIPVIMVTAKVSEEDRLRGLECGVDAYLPKPFNTEELLLRISNLMKQREVLRQKYEQASALLPISANMPQDHFMKHAKAAILEAVREGKDLSVASLAEQMGINTRQLHRKVTALTGDTPVALIRTTKIELAQRILTQDPSVPMKNVAIDCGFTDYSHFVRGFKNVTGKTPSDFIKDMRRPREAAKQKQKQEGNRVGGKR